jgi:hypothetical protein
MTSFTIVKPMIRELVPQESTEVCISFKDSQPGYPNSDRPERMHHKRRRR